MINLVTQFAQLWGICDDRCGCRVRAALGKLGVAVNIGLELRGAARGGGSHRACRLACAVTGAAAFALVIGAGDAAARQHVHHHHTALTTVGFGPSPVGESIVLDANTGQVLSEANADAITYPASLTKMMTLYLTFEALNTGRLRLDQYLPVSVQAAMKAPTKLDLRPGESVAVQDLIFGIVTKSANDAAAVLAEGLAGSEPVFADMMNRKAAQLGMRNTVYRNASGLPDPSQQTTARDTAQLALALYHDFPREYRYFSTREFVFHGRLIVGHDHLLDWYPGADGIKTGYIRASGFNLATSAVRDGHRLIGVVLGGLSGSSRDREMAALLDQGFAAVGVPPVAAIAHREMPRPAPAALPAVAAAPPPQIAAAMPPAPPPPTHAKSDMLGKAAARLAAHLSPVGKAEAATLPQPPLVGERWSIQLGAFRAPAAAERAAREASALAVVKGKPVQIVEPGRGGRSGLYRARLLSFTPAEAQSACAQLHKRRLDCTVLPPASAKVAAR
jgi:D-alanyl-D-alanine carboxypeptidase